jgi:hypothetical protein
VTAPGLTALRPGAVTWAGVTTQNSVRNQRGEDVPSYPPVRLIRGPRLPTPGATPDGRRHAGGRSKPFDRTVPVPPPTTAAAPGRRAARLASELDKINHLADSRRHEAFPNEAMAGPAAQVARTAAPAAPAPLLVPLLARRPRPGPAREPPGRRRAPPPPHRLAWLAHPAGCGPRVRLPQVPGFPADPVTVRHDEPAVTRASGSAASSTAWHLRNGIPLLFGGLCGCRNLRWSSGREVNLVC